MQWVALDDEYTVFASEADKQKRYRCPECGTPVRVRSGPHRQAHFYHLRTTKRCHQHQKSEEHLSLQLHLIKQLPDNEARIERPFPEVGRIADVAWERKRIVFEVQCSPISLTQAQERTRDYRSVGWQLIWILSDKRFNRRKLTTAERYLRQQTAYFASWNKWHAVIYDQWEVVIHFQRLCKGPPIALNPSHIAQLPRMLPQDVVLPCCAQERLDHWPLCLEADMLMQLLEQPATLHFVLQKERHLMKKKALLPFMTLLKQSYRHLLEKLLYTICRK